MTKGEPCDKCEGTGKAAPKAVKVKSTRYDMPADPAARAYADAYLAGAEGHRRRLDALAGAPVPKSFTTAPGKLTKPDDQDRHHSNQIRLNFMHPLLIQEVE